MRFQHLCVLGLGYIGLPTACTFAAHGLRVTGVDINASVVDTLASGGLHIHEPGLRALVQDALSSGNLSVQCCVLPADAYIIAVPTPFKENKQADLSYVISAAESIVPHLRAGSLVVLESTSPPRTTVDVVLPILERGGLKAGRDFFLAYSPERVLPGQILRELVENARVIGGIDAASSQAGRDLYALFVRGEIVLTDATTAEMVKLMENTYRDISIAAANEFSRLAERFGVDVWEAIALANRHPRIKILSPGPGVGGHCISVDPWFFVDSAPDLAQLIRAAREVNDGQPQFVVAMLREALHGLKYKTIAALGLAYKPDVDDLRESPAAEICRLLAEEGAQVLAYEPFKPDAQIPGVHTVPALAETMDEADCLLLLVGHTALRQLDPHTIAQLTKARVAVDCVNGWPQDVWEGAGFHLYKLGDGKWRGRALIRVLSIFGTRPEAVKMAPVVLRLRQTPGIESTVCVTAQHRQMLDQVLDIFGIAPDIDLNLMQPNQGLAQLTAAIFTHLDPVLKQVRPDWLLVQGDTTTVMAAALLGFYNHIRVGHVEAGLRTNDRWQPFPEEINRRVAGVVADLHFAPTEHARRNLLLENVPDKDIRVTGNPAIDALRHILTLPIPAQTAALLECIGVRPGGRRLALVTAHRRENFGQPLEDICAALRALAERYPDDLAILYPVHLNPNVQEPVHRLLGSVPNITLTGPQDYLPMSHLIQRSTIVLTDSGGIQEEATSLGKPALVLREVTERPEGVEAGVLRLVGTDPGRIVPAAVELLENPAAYAAMAQAANPFGDGRAAEYIVRALLDYSA